MKIFFILLLTLGSQAWGIELIIGGKTYYIEKYQIKDNGKTIEIPYTIHLDQAALKSKNCNQTQSVVQEGGRKPAGSSGFGDLMKSVEGGFRNLQNSIGPRPHKSRRNYR